MTYAISSRGYLERAEFCLENRTQSAMFYAALELRCGIEARMKEYLDAWDHVSRKQKKGWRVAELGSNIERAFRLGSTIVRLAVHERHSDELIVCLYHTPVPRSLQTLAQRFGAYLHAQNTARSDEDEWWTTLRGDLDEACAGLRLANTGTLLGPPLLQNGTNKADLKVEIPPGYDPQELLAQITAREISMDVSYLRKLPDQIEDKAMVWRRVG